VSGTVDEYLRPVAGSPVFEPVDDGTNFITNFLRIASFRQAVGHVSIITIKPKFCIDEWSSLMSGHH
jgi:hypothetical protein